MQVPQNIFLISVKIRSHTTIINHWLYLSIIPRILLLVYSDYSNILDNLISSWPDDGYYSLMT